MRAFVVRAFGKKSGVNFDRVDEQLIRPALATVGLQGGTTGLIVEAGNIRDDVIQELIAADVVVADVSVHNANVFYELGIRHAVRNRATVLIRARIDEVPFDLRGERYLSYNRSDPASSLPQLVQALRETLATERVDSPVYRYMPGLAAGDRTSPLGVPRDLAEDIGQAREQRWAGDLRLIAEEVAGLRFEEAALRMVGRASADVGDDIGARDSWERIRAARPDDVQANRALSEIYRRLENLIASDQAIERALGGAALTNGDRAELHALRASNSKRRWAARWRTEEVPAARLRVALRSRELDAALLAYRGGFDADLNHWYSGLNALALTKVTLELAARDPWAWRTRFETDEQADEELRQLEVQAGWLASTVRASLDTARDMSRRDGTTDQWLDVSIADLRLLTSSDPDRVAAAYEAVLSTAMSQATLRSIREQVEFYRDLDVLTANAEAALSVLTPEAVDPETTAPIQPLVFSGHLIDHPDRPTPRFPADKESVARDAIRVKVKEILEQDPKVSLLGMSGASDGGDLLFQEVCGDLGIQTHVLLPVPELIYRRTALSGRAARWAERYHRSLNRAAKVRILSRNEALPGWLATRPDCDLWERNNRWILNHAWAHTTTGSVTVLALWNGQESGFRGGVADMVATGQNRSAEVLTLDTVSLFGLTDCPDEDAARPA